MGHVDLVWFGLVLVLLFLFCFRVCLIACVCACVRVAIYAHSLCFLHLHSALSHDMNILE